MSEPRDDAADAPARGSTPSSDPLIHDDDELASALAAQLLRYSATGSIRIVPPADEVDGPVEAEVEASAPVSEPAPAVTLSPTPMREFAAVAPDPEPSSEPEPEPEPSTEGEPEPEAMADGEPEPTTVALDLTEIIRQEEGTDFRSFAAAAGIPIDDVTEDVAPTVRDDEAGAPEGVETPAAAQPVSPTSYDAATIDPPTVVADASAPVVADASSAPAEDESALERALRLEPALADLTVDDATYADWEQSLLALSATPAPTVAPGEGDETASAETPAAGPEAESSGTDDLRPEESEAESDSVRPSDPERPSDLDASSEPDDRPGPRRQTFTAPVPAVVSAPVAIAGEAETGASDEPDEPTASEGESAAPATSTIEIGTQPAATVPADELVATPLGTSGDGDAEIVEAEVVEADDASHSADEGDVTAPASSEVGAEPVASPSTGEIATALAPTPPRWAEDSEHPFGGMARPRVPGVPLTSADIPAREEPDDGIPAAPARPVGEADETPLTDDTSDAPAPIDKSTAPVDEPTETSVPVSSDYLITDTGPLTLGRGVQGPRIDTGSVPIVTGGMALDVDLDDDVDDVAAPVETLIEGDAPMPIAPAEPGDHTGPIVPISTAALIAGPPTVAASSSVGSRNVSTDTGRLSYSIPTAVGTEPGPSGFGPNLLAWSAPTATVLALALGAVLVGSGLSPVQGILAAVLGGALGAIPLALVTHAAARSRVSAAVASRSVFGAVGAAVTSVLMLIVRVATFAVVLWLLAGATRSLVFESGYDLFIAPDVGGAVAVGLAGLGAAALAVLSGRAVTRALWGLSALAILSTALLIIGTALSIDVSGALSAAGSPPLALVAGATAVLAALSAAWVGVGADVTAQRADGRSAIGSAFGVALGTVLPLVVLVGWGAVLAGAAAGSSSADLLATDPVAALAQALPGWYPLPLLVALLAPAVAGLIAVARSGGAALVSLGGRIPSIAATIATAVVGLCAAALLVVLAPSGTGAILTAAPLVAVPVLAWAGLVGVDALRRVSPLDRGILTGERPGLPAVRWGALAALVVITAVGWGLLAPLGDPTGVSGWIWRVAGVGGEPIAATGLGVVAALVLGAVAPLVLGRGARSEDASSARATPSELLSGALDQPGARRA